MTSQRKILSLLSVIPLSCLVASQAAAAREASWDGEVGLFVGHHDNFFFRGGDNQAPTSNLVTGAVQLERRQDMGPGEWTFGLAGEVVGVTDVDRADYQTLGLSTEYKQGPWKASLAYERLLNRLYSESGEAVFFDESEIDIWVRYSVTSRLWIRARAAWSDQNFDPLQDARDADATDFSATARYSLTPRLGLRASLLFEDRQARGAENNRTGMGVEAALEGQFAESTTWFLRYRQRDRDYEEAPIDDSNFGRNDTIDEVSFNVRWLFRENLGLMVRDNYRSGDSTRADRNFTGNVLEAGVFFQFGNSTED